MTIRLRDFKGAVPHRAPRYLPEQYGQIAANSRLENGELAPVRAPLDITAVPTGTETVFHHAGEWLTWTTAVNAVPGPVATDRLYYTGQGVPKMRVNGTEYVLALPGPQTAPTVAVLTAPDPEAETYQTIVFAITWVTEFGEESAPSPLTTAVEWSEGTVQFTNFPSPPANRGVTGVRLYQSLTSALGTTELYFKGEATLAEIANPWEGATINDDLNEPISTGAFSIPPDFMEGLISMPNGMMVAFDGRSLLFSEPYQPHAWPDAYRLEVDYPIVGLAAFGSSLAVMTEGTPYRGQGTHPDSFSLEKIEETLPCVSAASIVDLGYAAAYASTDGLVQISSTGAALITGQLFTREQWQKLDPATIKAGRYDGRYVFTFDGDLPAGPAKTGMLDLSGAQPFLVTVDLAPAAFYSDLPTGRLLYVDPADDTLKSWDDPASPSFMVQSWRSKLFELPFAASYSWIEVIADLTAPGSTLAVRVFIDGAQVIELTEHNAPSRLPAIAGRKWEIEVEGDMKVASIALATSMQQLVG